MQSARIRTDELIGLGAAVLLHVGLVAILLSEPEPPIPVPMPERITVSLAEDVGLESASPNPAFESRLAVAPELSDVPAPPITETAPPSLPAPTERSAVRQEKPKDTTPKDTTRRQQTRQQQTRQQQTRRDQTRQQQTRQGSTRDTAQNKRGGATKIGDNFLDGAGTSTTSSQSSAAAQTLGAREIASLDSAIGRQVKAKWQGRVPQGPDAEKLVTRVRFKLNSDGSLAGEPVVVGQTTGVTELNRNQVGRHQEEAVRAIKLAARFNVPFEIPANLSTFTLKFDRNY